MLSIHLFNFIGYSVVFRYLMARSDSRINQQIDIGEYDRAALLILKVPMHLPYFTDWKDFERAEGEIEIEGTHYTYVEKKFSNDTLYLACLPNSDKTSLSQAKHSFASEQNATPAGNKKNNEAGIKKGLIGSEYYNASSLTSFANTTLCIADSYFGYSSSLTSAFLAAPFTPPDMA